jgi:hypothetical protein
MNIKLNENFHGEGCGRNLDGKIRRSYLNDMETGAKK